MGETILDILFQGRQPVAAVPGGSSFNSIVSVGRAGVPCAFFDVLSWAEYMAALDVMTQITGRATERTKSVRSFGSVIPVCSCIMPRLSRSKDCRRKTRNYMRRSSTAG